MGVRTTSPAFTTMRSPRRTWSSGVRTGGAGGGSLCTSAVGGTSAATSLRSPVARAYLQWRQESKSGCWEAFLVRTSQYRILAASRAPPGVPRLLLETHIVDFPPANADYGLLCAAYAYALNSSGQGFHWRTTANLKPTPSNVKTEGRTA